MKSDIVTSQERPAVLCVGAHPDDLEIGMGGTIAKLIAAGWPLWYCVLTTEKDQQVARIRASEATSAARHLGIPESRVLFADFPDGNLQCNGDSVSTFRRLLRKYEVDPHIVFSHCSSDSHNDHRAAHELCLSTFRKKLFLCYGVVNSLQSSAFNPKVFTNITDWYQLKSEAILLHESQSKRIDSASIDRLTSKYAEALGLKHVEGFEVLVQEGAEDAKQYIAALNDSPFNRFWYGLVGDGKLIVVHAVPVNRQHKEWDWPSDKDREGLALLRRAFKQHWHALDPIEEYACATPNIERMMESSHIILSGGAVSNTITSQYFNHFQNIRYVIDFTMPDYRDIHICDRIDNVQIVADYVSDDFGGREVAVDKGILTIMPNPLAKHKIIIGCMGIHGFGTLGVYKALCNGDILSQLQELLGVKEFGNGLQAIVKNDILNRAIELDSDSVHPIGA